MNNREQAKLTRNTSLANFLTDNAAVYATNVAFSALATTYFTDNGNCMLAASKVNADNTGFSELKTLTKQKVAEIAASLSGAAQVKFQLDNRIDLALELHDAETYYSNAADADCAARCVAALAVLTDNLASLTNYVSAAELTDFSTALSAYLQAEGSSGSTHSISPAYTAAFKDALSVVDTDIKFILKLGRKYKTLAPAFYQQLVAVSHIPAVNVHHTTINGYVFNAATHLPIANAQLSLSNSTRTGISATNGFFEIEFVHGGNCVLTVSCAGFITQQTNIYINSGHDNPFNINLTAV